MAQFAPQQSLRPPDGWDPSSDGFSLPTGTCLQGSDQGNCYTLQSQLGEGAFGVVYRAFPGHQPTPTTTSSTTTSTTSYALKILRGPNYKSDYEVELANLQKVSITCPTESRLVRLVEAFQDRGLCCLVVAPLGRTDLRRVLEDSPASYSLEDVKRWCIDIAEGLQALHNTAHILHGDVCARNVLIGYDGHAYLTDYGIALHLNPFGYRQEDVESTKYSASIAPEMLESGHAYDAAADVWSVGVLIDALLSKSFRSYTTSSGGGGRTSSTSSARERMIACHNFFLGLRSDASAYDSWMQGLLALWPATEAATIHGLTDIIVACACRVQDRISLPSVVSRLHSLLSGDGLAFALKGLPAKWLESLFDDLPPEVVTSQPNNQRQHMMAMVTRCDQVLDCSRRMIESGVMSFDEKDIPDKMWQIFPPGSRVEIDCHLWMATFLAYKGLAHESLNEQATAQPCLERSLEMFQELGSRVLSDEMASSANKYALFHLAGMYHARGEDEAALTLYLECLGRGDLNPSQLCAVLSNSATILEGNNKPDAAWVLREAVLQFIISEANLEDAYDRISLATLLSNKAYALMSLGSCKEAIELLQRTLSIRRDVVPSDQPGVADSLSGLAMCYFWNGEDKLARPLYEEAIEIMRGVEGPQRHGKLSVIPSNFAVLLEEQGQYQEALDCCLKVYALRRANLPVPHFKIIDILDHLLVLYLHMSDYDHALEYGNLALNVRRELYSTDEHPDMPTNLYRLARAHGGLGQEQEATTPLEQAVDIARRLCDPYDTDRSPALDDPAAVYEARGDYARALDLQLERLMIVKREHGCEDHLDVAMVLDKVASLYAPLKRFSEAIQCCGEALGIRRRIPGGDHDAIVHSLQNLANSYRLRGRQDKAYPLCTEAVEVKRRLLALGEQQQGRASQEEAELAPSKRKERMRKMKLCYGTI